ncbi:hypothetical protein BBJ28_00021184, partial [Nothophytophthora sp. Chile5]
QFEGVGTRQRKAQMAWELQFLKEEALLRELLLLTLVASKERASLASAVMIAKTVQNWELKVFSDVFTPSTLAQSVAQTTARRVTLVGLLVALRMLQSAGGGKEHAVLQQVTRSFFLSELCSQSSSMEEDTTMEAVASPVPGVLLLSWAALLGHQYRELAGSDEQEMGEVEEMLQQTLAAAERLHGFHYLNALLRSLVFQDDRSEAGADLQPFLKPVSVNAKTIWTLPSVAAAATSSGSGSASQFQLQMSPQSAAIYQHVAAAFLNDMLSSLGYLRNLEGVQQLHAMVKLVLPVLANVEVAQQTLGMEVGDTNMTDDSVSFVGEALHELLQKTRAGLPQSLLSCVQMYTALCCNYEGLASPTVLHQVLKEFSKPIVGLEEQRDDSIAVSRQLPPDEYFREIEEASGRVECTRSFAYDDEDGRLVVPAGTIGVLSEQAASAEDAEHVQWLVVDVNTSSLWDLLILSTHRFVAGLQSGSLLDLHRTNAEDVEVLTAFFELLVQLSRQRDGGQTMLEELDRRWGEARLRRWWMDHRLPFPGTHVPRLVSQQIALPTLLAASREDLVAWGIRDRYTREQILAQLGGGGRGLAFGSGDLPSTTRHTFRNAGTTGSSSFGVDGATHLLRVLLGVLDGFLHSRPGASDDDMAGDGDSAWSAAHLHLVGASFSALRALLATSVGVDLLMDSALGGGREECVNLVVKSAKKLFELQERLVGEYPVVLATLEIFMSVARWFFAQEARSLGNPGSSEEGSAAVGSHAFVEMERHWFVGAAEFVIEVVATHESWKFASIHGRCEVAERCFRLLFALASPRKYVHERNEMLPAFALALRETLASDMSLLMKLLRSSCAVLSTKEGHVRHWNSIAVNENDEETEGNAASSESDGHFPLVFEDEPSSAGVSLFQLESLVTTCLRLLSLLLSARTDVVDSRTARQILLTPIDDGGPKKRKSLTMVTLCAGYLAYPLDKAPGIAYWSLQILQHAAVVLDCRLEGEGLDATSTHSLVALFHGQRDLPIVRDAFARLLRASSTQHMALRKEVVVMLVLCLEHQPGFLALLLFGGGPDSDTKAEDKKEADALPFVALLERFFVASEQLLEQASDLFCSLLIFLVQVWKGAIHDGLGIHLQIMTALRARPTFWPNVTRALKIRMPLESEEERGPLDMELVVASEQGRGGVENSMNVSEAYVGRSSAYGYLARGLILQLVSYEWHNQASRQSDHPLVQVLETFRVEGLYAHWLRTFTRLDYSPARLAELSTPIRRFCGLRPPATNLLSDLPIGGGVSMYLKGLLCDVSVLKWQVSAGGKTKTTADARTLKLVKWSNLQAAYLHAQHFSLAKWKVFMEICLLQAGGTTASTSTGPSASVPEAAGDEEASGSRSSRQLKRKESMISSPVRGSVGSRGGSTSHSARLVRLAVSPSSRPRAESSVTSSSRFSGDRTSFGMIQGLADVIAARVDLHESQEDEALDYFMLVHLRDLAQLLVSMLHHQLCLVVRKTQDPKLSQTRQRLEDSEADRKPKLNAQATLALLAVVERTESVVRESLRRIARDLELVKLDSNDGDSLMASTPTLLPTTVPMWTRLVTDFEQKVETLTVGLHTSLLTAALLLVRHVRDVSDGHSPSPRASRTEDWDTDMENATPLLQVKLIAHCMDAITLCDQQSERSSATRALFQLSWCLFQQVLDDFAGASNTDSSRLQPKPKLRMASVVQLHPFVRELEHDQQGLGALFHLLVQRFRSSTDGKETNARQEEACQVLRGLVAVVWNPQNRELCQRVMLTGSRNASSRLRLLSMLATQLLPLLQTQMEREESNSELRGYAVVADDGVETDEKELERSVAHRMWCLVLDFVGGLLRLLSEETDEEDDAVWAFVAQAEPLLLAAVHPTTCQRLTRVVIAEHQALLRFVSALSDSSSRRKRWRQAFPTNAVVLMEQSRQLLRRACVLLGSSSAESSRLRKEKLQKQKQSKTASSKAVVGFSLLPKSPRSPRSPSAFTFAHQTLLHEQLQAVRGVEKKQLMEFHREMEMQLVELVRIASLLLTKWTAALTEREAILVVDGVRYLDEEQLVPLLAFAPPSEARSMTSDPSLGHLCLAMQFMLDQLLADDENEDEAQLKKTKKAKTVLASAVDASALLFLKTYLLHAEQYEHAKRDREEFTSFFRQLNGRLSGEEETEASAEVDVLLLQQIGKMQEDEPSTFVTYDRFEKKMLEVLYTNEYEPDSDETLLAAFRVRHYVLEGPALPLSD